jgi:hypothetical protein
MRFKHSHRHGKYSFPSELSDAPLFYSCFRPRPMLSPSRFFTPFAVAFVVIITVGLLAMMAGLLIHFLAFGKYFSG